MNSKTLNRALEIAQGLFDPSSILNCHVSIAFYKGKVVGIGQNQNKTDPTNLLNPKFNRNAENISSVRGVCSEWSLFKNLKNKTSIPFDRLEIVNVRINRNREVALSKPCQSCSSLLRFFEPKAIYFSNNHGQFEQYKT